MKKGKPAKVPGTECPRDVLSPQRCTWNENSFIQIYLVRTMKIEVKKSLAFNIIMKKIKRTHN